MNVVPIYYGCWRGVACLIVGKGEVEPLHEGGALCTVLFFVLYLFVFKRIEGKWRGFVEGGSQRIEKVSQIVLKCEIEAYLPVGWMIIHGKSWFNVFFVTIF